MHSVHKYQGTKRFLLLPVVALVSLILALVILPAPQAFPAFAQSDEPDAVIQPADDPSSGTAQAAGTYDVGIIPDQAGQCPAGSEYISIYMDDEDDDNQSSLSGWTGATTHRITNHINGSECTKVCKVS
jgi:hypothetical protein